MTYDPSRRQFHKLAFATLAAAAVPPVLAAEPWLPILPPQLPSEPGKIEVLEFFSWGCPHCRDFNPLLSRWAAKLPKDVLFRKVPVTFGRVAWANLARLFYALDSLDQLARLDDVVFAALHERRINLYTPEAARQWAAQQGVDSNRFNAAYSAFSTETHVARAEQLSRTYKVNSVPALAVAGRYMITAETAQGQAGMLKVADELLAKARKA